MDTAIPSKKEQTHERIVDAAARALRKGGFDAIGVADIMRQVGLTHGGFYAHFASREALLVEALERAGHDSRHRLEKAVESKTARGQDGFAAFVERYLSDVHLASPETGCPVAALGSELPRQSDAVREVAARRVDGLIERVQRVLPAGHPPGTAAVVASQLVGALQLARTFGDNARGKRHLSAVRRFLIEQFGSAPAGR
jgi:AcrR family transcriptional regulator